MGGGAHTTQEWFRPEGRDLGLKRIFLLLAHLMRGIPADASGERGQVSRRRAAEAALVFNVIVWGATFVLVKAALATHLPSCFWRCDSPWPRGRCLPLVPRRGFALAIVENRARGRCLREHFCLPATFSDRRPAAHHRARSAFITGLTSVAVPLLAALVYRVKPQVSEVMEC
jgi:hypothetical protein